MDLVLKHRADESTEPIRAAATNRLRKIEKLLPKAERLEIEVIGERGHISNGAVRLEGTIVSPRRSFRASAHGHDAEAATDQLLSKLERQLRDHHDKRRTRLGRGSRIKSARTSPEEGA